MGFLQFVVMVYMYLCTCVCEETGMYYDVCVEVKGLWGQFLPSTFAWVLGIELRLPGLPKHAFTQH